MWKLFLDDLRDPTQDGFTVARSTAEAKKLVEQLGPPEVMSLDHDLGGNDTANGIFEVAGCKLFQLSARISSAFC